MRALAFWRDVLNGRRGARVMLAAWAALVVVVACGAVISEIAGR